MINIWEERIVIPTYEVGEPNKNPIFIDSRVYQGSSGKLYPYPTIEKISDIKTDKEYDVVYLENDYIKIMVMPSLGGRIQRAYDKTNGYDFIYYNKVIKPALVGLAGPWISGGIEINWPQHHRPATFSPTDYKIVKDEQKRSVTLKINDVDLMYGTKAIASYTLYEDKAYLEIEGQLYNRTAFPQTFLWWANPAVAVNDNTQSIFPPDVHSVMDHGKRDVSKFPIATGVYYKKDYSDGVDISRYKNIPVPTSYMAEKSDFDFVGGYDYGVGAGLLHVADHHVSPGKKQWTWGCGDFGQAWDRNLTDEDGPYIELMVGVYTDNQPDFSWLKPFEEKKFKQYFMPYKAVGQVKNATIDASLNFEITDKGAHICVYATSEYKNASIVLKRSGREVYRAESLLSPINVFETKLPEYAGEDETLFEISVYSEDGRKLVSYIPLPKHEITDVPSPAEAALMPEEIKTNEELYLTALHIEQYRHATYRPDPYYLEGLKRDPGDIRINNAYGMLLLRRGHYEKAEEHFRAAIKRLTWKNGNPYDSEAYYNLGLSLWYQEKYDQAYDAFFKATWSNEQQEMSFYYLAAIDTMRGDFKYALELVSKALVKNSHNVKARALKAIILRKLGMTAELKKTISDNLCIDPFDYLSLNEKIKASGRNSAVAKAEMLSLMRDYPENFLQTARDYADSGCYEEAADLLELCNNKTPLVLYYQSYYLSKSGKSRTSIAKLKEAESCDPGCCFPNKLEDIAVLEYAIAKNPRGAKAYYYLGNLVYDKLQYDRAVSLWEKSVSIDGAFPTAYRNLALAYYNKCNKPEKSIPALEKAFALDTSDSRVFLELDQLYKKFNVSFEKRLENYNKYRETFEDRDDLFIEYITLHNLLGRYDEAYDLIMGRRFHPWEGGEGKITAQYIVCLVELAKQQIAKENYAEAKELLEKALVFPENLGEGKLEGSKDNNIYYYLGIVNEKLGDTLAASACYEKASLGATEVAGMMYYNDQPADMVLYKGLAKLKEGKVTEAKACFNRLSDFGEKHIFDNVKIEYFAVSLPDFCIYNDDLNKRNKAHCYYVMGLGAFGHANYAKAREYFTEALKYDMCHLNCIRFLNDINNIKGINN